MTKDSTRKRAVREHMRATGLTYMQALRALADQDTKPEPAPAAAPRKRLYVAKEFCEATGLRPFQLNRAVTAGLIPQPEVTAAGRERWPAAVVEQTKPLTATIVEAVGRVPSMGVTEAAAYLAGKFGVEVTTDTVRELARQQLLARRKLDTGPMPYEYDGRALEAFSNAEALERAAHDGQTMITDMVVQLLNVRRSDVDALIDRGWLRPLRYVQNPNTSKRSKSAHVALYRRGDIDELLADPAIDWNAVRTVQKGQRSPLAKLSPRTTR